MRRMSNGVSAVNVIKHITLNNFWEYYIIDNDEYEPDSNIQYAYVMGFADEFGDVVMDEIKPYILTETSDLQDLAPATGFEWVKTEEK